MFAATAIEIQLTGHERALAPIVSDDQTDPEASTEPSETWSRSDSAGSHGPTARC
jgi:hypothetical protein